MFSLFIRKSFCLLLLLFLSMPVLQAGYDDKITLSTDSLPHFKGVYTGQFSDVQFYYVDAHGISQNLVISVVGPFKVSLDCREYFADSISLSPKNGEIVRERIYVRFFPESTGEKTGTITHQAGESGPVVLGLSGLGMASTIPDGYYESATGYGSQLKTQLFDIIDNHQPQTYASLWGHFLETDATFEGKVWDMYSNTPCQEPPYIYTFGDDQDTGSGGNEEGQVYNREHSVPQSWFKGAMPMYTELFHIFPVDKLVNFKRANYPYGEVTNPIWISENGGKLGANNLGNYTGLSFEPIDDYKGDIARGYFYVVTRYENELTSWVSNGYAAEVFSSEKFPGFKPWVLEMFLDWHTQDPVSQKEILRNQAIFEIQGNRNPFIDHPEFAFRIWDESSVAIADIRIQQEISVYPNPSNGWFFLDVPDDARMLEIFSIHGTKILSKALNEKNIRINTNELIPGLYLLIINTDRNTLYEKVLVQ